MAYIWGNSSHETPRQQLDIILPYTDCQFDHSLNIPHDCIYDLETCGLFEPSGPSGSLGSEICAACHYPRSSHPKVTSTPLHHKMALPSRRPYWEALLHPKMAHFPTPTYSPSHLIREMARSRMDHSPTRPYWEAYIQDKMARMPHRPCFPAHRGESSTRHAPEITHSPPRVYPAHRGGASTWGAPEMTHSPIPLPQPASEPGPAERWPVRSLTPERSKRLEAIAEKNNYKALKYYSKAEAEEICVELSIKRRCLSDWIYRRNLAREKRARKKATAKQEAEREAAAANEEDHRFPKRKPLDRISSLAKF